MLCLYVCGFLCMWPLVYACGLSRFSLPDSVRSYGLQPTTDRLYCPWIFQARILKGVAMPSSKGSFQPRDRTRVSCIFCIAGRFFTTESPGEPLLCMLLLLLLSRFSRVRLCGTPQTAAHQAPPSLGFSRQESWSGLLFPSPISCVQYPPNFYQNSVS